ncbi:MAG: hypothetical protein ACLR7D_03680 [Lachnospira eligens]
MTGFILRYRVSKENVSNLPEKWSEDFQLKHLNMSFDKPVPVTLRIKSEKCEGNPKRESAPVIHFYMTGSEIHSHT